MERNITPVPLVQSDASVGLALGRLLGKPMVMETFVEGLSEALPKLLYLVQILMVGVGSIVGRAALFGGGCVGCCCCARCSKLVVVVWLASVR